jgi:hypothetical protein
MLIFGQVMLFSLSQLATFSCAETYNTFVGMLQNQSPAIQMKGKDGLARIIKKNILKRDPTEFSEDTFQFGHFINPTTYDLAVGISFPRYWGNLVILTQKNGRYVPVVVNTSIAFIETIETTKLFPGTLDQLALNLFSGGSGVRHWAKDIYRWDGEKMRIIWAGVLKESYVKWPPGPQGEINGHIVRSEITFNDLRITGAKEIITVATLEEGIFNPQSMELEKVQSRREISAVHKWDETLFFYVAKYGKILSDNVTAHCWEGIPPKEGSKTFLRGEKVGILEKPGYDAAEQTYHTVTGKEHFCEISKSDVEIVEKTGVRVEQMVAP